MPNGTGYLFPENSTTIHVWTFGYRPWESNIHANAYQVLTMPDSMTVNQFLSRLEATFGTGKLRATEFGLRGNGEWQKRSSFVRDGDGGGKMLKQVGWGGCGKNGNEPLWLGLELA